MKTRAAVAFEAGKPLEIVEVDLEGPKAGEVLVEVKATGICHTDEFTLSGSDPEGLFPAILGHEGAGIVVDVGPVLLGEQIFIDPKRAGPGQDDRAVPVVVQALLEHATTQIVRLSLRHLRDCLAQDGVTDARLACRLGKPSRLECSFLHAVM